MLYTATKSAHPIAVRYPRSAGLGVEMDDEFKEIPVGKGEILRNGEDVALVAIGSVVDPAVKAAEKLAASGIEATVINARFAKPLDSGLLIDIANRIKRIVTVEENVLSGGFGNGVVDFLQKAGLDDVCITCVGLPDEFIEHGHQSVLRARYGLDEDGIYQRILAMFPEIQKKITAQDIEATYRM